MPALGPPESPLVLHHSDGRIETFDSVAAFAAATLQAVQGLATVEAVYAFWAANLKALPLYRGRQATPMIPSEAVSTATQPEGISN